MSDSTEVQVPAGDGHDKAALSMSMVCRGVSEIMFRTSAASPLGISGAAMTELAIHLEALADSLLIDGVTATLQVDEDLLRAMVGAINGFEGLAIVARSIREAEKAAAAGAEGGRG